MARKKPSPIYSKVALDEIEGLEGCTVTVWCNFPLSLLDSLSSNEPGSIGDFLAEVIKAWEGFDMPLSKRSIKELTMEETSQITPLILRHVANPQMRNCVTL